MINFPKPTVEQFFRTYYIDDFQVNDDETKLIFSTNLNGKINLWAMDLPDMFPYLFAHHDESIGFTAFDPQKRFVIAGYDNDGDENYQIYAVPYEGGLPQPLITGEPDEKFYYSQLSEDGNRLYYTTSKDNAAFLNSRVRNLEDGSDELIHEGETAPTQVVGVSDDERAFVFVQLLANTYIKSFVKIDEKIYNLVPDPDKVHVASQPLFTDNETIYFVTDYESNYRYVAKYDLKQQEFSKVGEIEEESVTHLKWDKKNEVFYLTTEKGVVDQFYRLQPTTGKIEKLNAPTAIINSLVVSKSGNLYILGPSATVPLNIYKSEDAENWTRLTNNRVLGVAQEEMVNPEVVTYSSFDGMEIEALLFKARPENDNGHTIFWPHGGPQAAEREFYRSMFQVFLNRGYTIFAPNFRGSTGYGSEFVKLVEQDWGEGPRLDNVAGIEWLFENGITDRDKLFLVGGSYGGYMALLLHGRHPEYFKAVIDIFGPSDLFTFVESVPPHWKPIMERWVGDPVRDKDRFIKDSPVTYLDNMTKPMLVIQGAKDPRVVKAESDQIVAKLKEKGREVEYLVLEDEGHGFSKKENEIKVYKKMLEFMEKHQG